MTQIYAILTLALDYANSVRVHCAYQRSRRAQQVKVFHALVDLQFFSNPQLTWRLLTRD